MSAARRNPGVAVGAAILAVFLVVAILGPALAPYPLDRPSGAPYGRPGGAHPLGLDDGGVDVLSLVLHGARTSMLVGFAAAAIGVVVGGLVGIVAGYRGGVLDSVLIAVTDFLLVIPTLPLMVVVAAVWGQSLLNIVILIGALSWMAIAYVVRAQVRSIKSRAYVQRAKAIGAGDGRILRRHVLPHVMPLLVANAVLSVSAAILAEAGLAFLGLGDPREVSWGSMIQEAFLHSAVSSGAWWAIVPAALCICVVVLACFLVGQGVEERINPRIGSANVTPRTFVVRSLTGGLPR